MSEHTPSTSARPGALPLADAARLLSKVGGRLVTVEMLQKDIDAGAPTNPDGTINIVMYAAWLVRGYSDGN
jgi:hypothetical protein